MERLGWVRSTWGRSENQRRAKFYTITGAGQTRLAEARQDWFRHVDAVARVLKLA